MKRVVFVAPDVVGPVQNGGIGTACLHYALSLVRAHYKVDIVFAGWPLDDEELARWRAFYKNLEISFYAINDCPALGSPSFGFRWYTEVSWRIYSWLRTRDIDCIIFQDWKAEGFWSVRAKQMGLSFANVPLAVIAHAPSPWQMDGMKTIGKDVMYEADLSQCECEAISGADLLICPSEHIFTWLKSHQYALPRRVEICPVTFECDVARPLRRPIDLSHLIFFGRLETRKGLHIFADALRAMKKAGFELPNQVSFLGKHGTVQGIASELYIDRLRKDLPEVEMAVESDLDHSRAIRYIYIANGVVVVPSLMDNCPLTVLESVANGFPIIASQVGGIPEMLDRRALFAPDVAGLVEKLVGLTQNDFASFDHTYRPVEARKRFVSVLDDLTSVPSMPAISTRQALPPISVCIPFYKHDRYVRRLVDAFSTMCIPDLQLVIVDDGTPAEERAELDALRPALEAAGHIVVIQANAGPAAARNSAIAAASSDLLLFFDSDNVPFPDLVAKLWHAMEKSGGGSIAAPFLAVPPMSRMPNHDDVLWRYQPNGVLSALSLFENTLGDMSALIERKHIDSVGGFDTTISIPGWEDWEIFLRLSGNGCRHFVYPEPLLYYTDHPGREKSSTQLYDLRKNMINQLDLVSHSTLKTIAKTFAGQIYAWRDADVW